jgi:hypothetical protein
MTLVEMRCKYACMCMYACMLKESEEREVGKRGSGGQDN